MKKLALFSAIAFLAGSLSLTSCGSSEEAPATDSTAVDSVATEVVEEVVDTTVVDTTAAAAPAEVK